MEIIRVKLFIVFSYYLLSICIIYSEVTTFILFFKKKLFIYLFMAALGLCFCVRAFSNCVEQGGYSSLQCTGFLLLWLLLLRSMGSRHTGFSSCGTWAQQLWLTGSRARRLSSCGAQV